MLAHKHLKRLYGNVVVMDYNGNIIDFGTLPEMSKIHCIREELGILIYEHPLRNNCFIIVDIDITNGKVDFHITETDGSYETHSCELIEGKNIIRNTPHTWMNKASQSIERYLEENYVEPHPDDKVETAA